ncbi:MAG: hypothetical protein VYD19_04635 [Myxococcota bacterium]|nr:hypothetical protein [Myxococcota bacterium]
MSEEVKSKAERTELQGEQAQPVAVAQADVAKRSDGEGEGKEFAQSERHAQIEHQLKAALEIERAGNRREARRQFESLRAAPEIAESGLALLYRELERRLRPDPAEWWVALTLFGLWLAIAIKVI